MNQRIAFPTIFLATVALCAAQGLVACGGDVSTSSSHGALTGGTAPTPNPSASNGVKDGYNNANSGEGGARGISSEVVGGVGGSGTTIIGSLPPVPAPNSSGCASPPIQPPVPEECKGLPVPLLARVCPGGASAGLTYVLENGKCVLRDEPCPPAPPIPVCNFELTKGCNVCPDGKIACAHYVIKDGKCGSEICPSSIPPTTPPPAPVPPPKPVCNFLLPHICKVCDDGKSACAHYVIKDNKCEMEICPPAPSVPPPVDGCSQGAPCSQNSGCGTASSSDPKAPNGGCSTACSCDPTGHFQCSSTCESITIEGTSSGIGSTAVMGSGAAGSG